MSIKVVTNDTFVRRVTVGTNTTLVKKVTVGTPIRRVSNQGGLSFGDLAGVDIENASDGSMLVYNGSNLNFEAKVEIDNPNTNFNGGNF